MKKNSPQNFLLWIVREIFDTVTSALPCVPYQSDYFKIADPSGERATFLSSRSS